MGGAESGEGVIRAVRSGGDKRNYAFWHNWYHGPCIVCFGYYCPSRIPTRASYHRINWKLRTLHTSFWVVGKSRAFLAEEAGQAQLCPCRDKYVLVGEQIMCCESGG